jgi:NADH-quinone oxidoreductase subunit G
MEITIDGKSYAVTEGDNLLHACLSLGFDLPYFCWHPALGSVGACRQCAVKQIHGEDDRRTARIVMACMTPVTEGMRVIIADPEAVAFRAAVIEWLMTNHPHDCPVCPEGGECHLQDMTVMSGHVARRYRFTKRTFCNQYLGPFIHHEMNRCIACYRCVRFYRDYAGGRDFDVFAIHRDVFFGRHQDGVLENEFSGNLAEVCPTGVFTDKTLDAAYNRKWDMRGAPSVCAHCGLGCNTTPNERLGKLRRILNRYNHAVNGYFLCDRGRFGYGFVNGAARIRAPLLHQRPVSRDKALRHLGELLSGRRPIGIGSPRASLEANFALRTLVGVERFHLGLSDNERRLLHLTRDVLRDGPARAASIGEAEQADAVLVLGEDLPNTAPRLALALRQAVRQRSFTMAEGMGIPRWQDAAVREAAQRERSPLFLATPTKTRLDELASHAARLAPDDIARLGFAIAHAVDPAAPAVAGLAEEAAALASQVAAALTAAERPLVIAGSGCASAAVIEAAANVAWALCRRGRPSTQLHLVTPECNSMGLALMDGGSLDDALAAIAAGRTDTLVVLENDLYRRADRATVDRALAAARHLVVLDHLLHETAVRAEIALPAGSFAEADGTLVSSEGRAQRFFQVFVPEGDIQESWRWLKDAAIASGRNDAAWPCLDEVTTACAAAVPALAAIADAAPAADFRVAGARIPRQPHRTSGRTALDAQVTVHEPKPPEDPDTPLSFTMEGYYGPMPPALLPYTWAPAWNSPQAINKFQQEVGGPLRGGDPGRRLIEPKPQSQAPYFADVPTAFATRPGAWLVLPLYEVFGSEELSRLAPAVAERVPEPYLAVGADDAVALGVAEGDPVSLSLAGATRHLTARIGLGLPAGTAGLFDLAPDLPAWGTVTAEARHG